MGVDLTTEGSKFKKKNVDYVAMKQKMVFTELLLLEKT